MLIYALFSPSKFLYKFADIQGSEDICGWKGRGWYGNYEPEHEWTLEHDAMAIFNQIRDLEESLGFLAANFTSHSFDCQGTTNLLQEIDSFIDLSNKMHCFYRLGCVIYHQLLYNEKLSCMYNL
jgi:hypothetical protein